MYSSKTLFNKISWENTVFKSFQFTITIYLLDLNHFYLDVIAMFMKIHFVRWS